MQDATCEAALLETVDEHATSLLTGEYVGICEVVQRMRCLRERSDQYVASVAGGTDAERREARRCRRDAHALIRETAERLSRLVTERAA